MLRFIDIEIEGFGSIVNPITIKFGKKGLFVIKGDNGVGKSTIFSALHWVWYGKPLKDNSTIETWDHVRPDDYKGVRVTSTAKKDGKKVKVTRFKSYTGKYEGSKGGERLIIEGIDNLSKKKREAQSQLEEFLGYSSEVFRHTVVFGQGIKKLVDEGNADKKKIFEKALDVEFVDEVRERVKKDKLETEEVISKYNDEIDTLEDQLAERTEELEDALGKEKTFDKAKEEKIKSLKKKLKGIRVEDPYNKVEHQRLLMKLKEADFDNVAEFHKNTTYKVLIKTKSSVEFLGKTIESLTEELDRKEKEKRKPTPHCKYCGNPIDAEAFEEEWVRIKKETSELILKQQEKVKERKRLKRNVKKLRKIYKLQEKIEACEIQLESHRRIVKERETLEDLIRSEEASKFTIDIPKLKTKVKKLSNKIEAKEKDLRKVKKELKYLNWLLKDPLGNNGIKSYILFNLIDRVNIRLEEYSKYIGFIPELHINRGKKNKDFEQFVFDGAYLVKYEDLSGGQKQLVDVVTAFAIDEEVSQNLGCNITLMDEIFEGLNTKNIELITNIIQDKAKDSAVYVITHRESFNPLNATELKIELENKVTNINRN